MTAVPLYSQTVERWAIVATGEPAHRSLRAFAARGLVRIDPQGRFRLQRRPRGRRPALDQLVEIRRFEVVVEAYVDTRRSSPRVRFRERWQSEAEP